MRSVCATYCTAAALLFVLGGCASNIDHIAAPQEAVPKNKVFNASLDTVWGAAQRVLSEETSFKILDKSSGIMVTEPQAVDSKELSYAQTVFFAGKTYKSSYTLNFAPAGAGKTDVKLNVKLQAVQLVLMAREEPNEGVEGYLRQKLFEKIAANVK
jgi:hypothetical protein